MIQPNKLQGNIPFTVLQAFGEEVAQQLLDLHRHSSHLLLCLEFWIPISLAGIVTQMQKQQVCAHSCWENQPWAVLLCILGFAFVKSCIMARWIFQVCALNKQNSYGAKFY